MIPNSEPEVSSFSSASNALPAQEGDDSLQSLSENFNLRYEIVRATTEELISESQRLRYKIFCPDTSVINKDNFEEEIERDEFDQRSIHDFIRNKKNGQAVASVRLVLADPQNEDAAFPMEKHCGEAIRKGNVVLSPFSRKNLGEISRFVVSRKECQCKRVEGRGRFFDCLTLGLARAVMEMTASKKVTHIYACMEPAFHRLLGKYAISFKPLGPVVNYFGMRQPCFAVVDELLERVFHERYDVWDFITDGGQLCSLPSSCLSCRE